MDGILLVDKPKGWTSFDVVAKVRGILKQAQREKAELSHLDAVQGSSEERVSRTQGTVNERQSVTDAAMRQEPAGLTGSAGQHGKAVRKIRVGHTGTLDPLATGLLVLLIGNYTKKAPELSKLDKTYEVKMKLGQTSTTADEEGEKTLVSSKQPSIDEIQQAMKVFEGEIEQTPPIYSAIKVGGQRAYKLARAGKEVKLEPRKATVYSLEFLDYKYPFVKFTAKVSSGTYIRSLVEDIGQKLGTGAYMSDLNRTEVGQFNLKDAVEIKDLTKENIDQSTFNLYNSNV